MRLREQARSVYGKLSDMANAEMNEKDGKSFSSGEEDENVLLAEDGNDHDTTGVHTIAPINYGSFPRTRYDTITLFIHSISIS